MNRNLFLISAMRERAKYHIGQIFCAAFCVLTLGLNVHPSRAISDSPKTTEQEFKNLKVLNHVRADELIPAMQFISASLGVQCDFCHVRDAFDRDDKETKQVARRMISMMLTINGQNFRDQRAVTCYTCHHGSAKAVAIPLIEAGAPYLSEASALGPDRAQGQGNLPAAEDVVSRFVTAVGGGPAIERIQTRLEKGTVTFGGGPSMDVEVSTKAPNKQIMTVHLPQGDASTAFDGQKGWVSAPGAPTREMNQADFEGARIDSDLQFPVDLKTTFRELKVIQKERIGNQDTILVFAVNPGQPPLELYFDQNSGLLVRQVRFAKSPLGLNPTRIDYTDYKQFDGVNVPMHLTIDRPSRNLEIQFVQVTQNIPVDDGSFKRPQSAD